MSLGASAPLHIIFLGPLRAAVGADSCALPCPAAGSQTELWAALCGRFPVLRERRNSIRLARNGEFLQEGEGFAPGDEIALLPPVSGG